MKLTKAQKAQFLKPKLKLAPADEDKWENMPYANLRTSYEYTRHDYTKSMAEIRQYIRDRLSPSDMNDTNNTRILSVQELDRGAIQSGCATVGAVRVVEDKYGRKHANILYLNVILMTKHGNRRFAEHVWVSVNDTIILGSDSAQRQSLSIGDVVVFHAKISEYRGNQSGVKTTKYGLSPFIVSKSGYPITRDVGGGHRRMVDLLNYPRHQDFIYQFDNLSPKCGNQLDMKPKEFEKMMKRIPQHIERHYPDLIPELIAKGIIADDQ